MTTSVRYESEIPQILSQLTRVEQELAASSVDAHLRHLVKLRASQINQCAYCVKLHTTEARRDGETNERLDRLVVWRHTDDFSPAEKAALAWTEALTELDPHLEPAALRGALHAHFTTNQVANLTALIGMINLWNRLAISQH